MVTSRDNFKLFVREGDAMGIIVKVFLWIKRLVKKEK